MAHSLAHATPRTRLLHRRDTTTSVAHMSRRAMVATIAAVIGLGLGIWLGIATFP
jgi:hypothetical protein